MFWFPSLSFQFRYGLIWSTVVGRVSGTPRVMELYAGEAIIQISGKYTSRIFSVIFITNNGRSLSAGQPVGHSFNMYANSSKAELRKVSGRQRGRISSFAAHWAVVDPTFNQNTEHWGWEWKMFRPHPIMKETLDAACIVSNRNSQTLCCTVILTFVYFDL